MNAQTLLESFETFADARGGISRLRELILELAVAGRLTEQHHRLPPHASQVEEARKAKGPQLKKKGANGIPLERLPNESEYPFSLPLSWIFVRIDDVAEYFNGCAFKAGDHSNTGLPIIRIQNLTNSEAEFNYTKLVLDTRNIAQSGDILVSWSATLDAFKWSGPTGGVNQHIFKVEPNTDLVSQGFLHQVLRWTMKRLAASEALHGLAMKHVNRGDFTAAIIPLPPLDEQREIELRLQQLFELCDQLEAAKAERDALRTAARKSAIDAVSSASTPDELSTAWARIRDNWTTIADTPESVPDLRHLLLSTALKGALTPSNRDDWNTSHLGDLGTWAGGNGFPPAEQGRSGEDILFCKVSDMNLPGNEKFIISTVNSISKSTASRLRVRAHPPGTVIFPKIGGAIATNKRRILVVPTAIDNNCMGLTPSSLASSEWLFVLLTSLDFTQYQSGTSLPALSQGKLNDIVVEVPPLDEQERIVAKVDELMALCDQLESELKTRDDLAGQWAASSVHHIGDAA